MDNPKNYRPITLLPEHGKIFEKVIRSRLYVSKQRLHLDKQYDFTPDKSTIDGLEVFMSNCKDPKHKYIATIFAGIKGAFDNVWWSGLQYLIKNLELPGYLPSILGSYVDDRMVTTGISQLPRDAPRDAHRALSSVRHYGTWY
jgi:hypothetical protein